MTTWFTSDTHFGHSRVIEYAKRPFADSEEMDETLVERWNRVIRPADTVYHLGDFALTKPGRALEIARRLQGRKHLVFGNHDKALRKDVAFLGAWVWAKDLTQVAIEGQKITLCHYAMRTWASAHHGAWQLYGHSHGSLSAFGRAADVGVDCWDYSPVSFETLVTVMANRTFQPVDYHDSPRQRSLGG